MEKFKPHFYGKEPLDDGGYIDWGTLIDEGKCYFVGKRDKGAYNFDKDKEYPYTIAERIFTEGGSVYTECAIYNEGSHTCVTSKEKFKKDFKIIKEK